jgi:hypothetical protein
MAHHCERDPEMDAKGRVLLKPTAGNIDATAIPIFQAISANGDESTPLDQNFDDPRANMAWQRLIMHS